VTLEKLIKSTCEDWVAEVQVPVGLADRALRRRTRQRSLRVALAAGSTALLIGAAAVVVSVNGDGQLNGSKGMSTPARQSAKMSTDTTLRTDLKSSSFPRRLVAAGHIAVAAYFTGRRQKDGDGQEFYQRTWFLYDPTSGMYQKTRWAHLAVAPGMAQAAVLEGPLPASRVGLLDLKTQKITRWIPVDEPVGGVTWAPDGLRLVLTSYSANPDLLNEESSRTGFYVLDSRSELGTFHAVPPESGIGVYRQDFGWSRSGDLLWSPTVTEPKKDFYDLNGNPHAAPPNENTYHDSAGLSPNGSLTTASATIPGPRAAQTDQGLGPESTSMPERSQVASGPSVKIWDVKTAEQVADLPVEQAKVWADDKHLFAIGCEPVLCADEFRNRLVLVDLDGNVTPLTGYRDSQDPGSWVPVFTHR
jgi:hypothetical protein